MAKANYKRNNLTGGLLKVSEEHIFYSAPHGIFKAYLNIYKTPCFLSDYHGFEIDINNRNNRQLTRLWKRQLSTKWKIGQDRNKDFWEFNEN